MTGQRTPFDISDLNNIPATRDDDPPYRDWWAVEERADDAEPGDL